MSERDGIFLRDREMCIRDRDSGKFELANADPLVYLHGGYFELGEKVGKFGWSVEKKRKKK